MNSRMIRRIMTVLLIGTVLATVLATAPSEAHAYHGDHGPHNLKRDARDLTRYGTWYKGEGGGTGSDGFYYTYKSSSSAYWNFGSLRGVFKASYYYPGSSAGKVGTCGLFDSTCKRRPPSASPKLQVQQQDYQGNWVTVHTLVDKYNSSRRGKWVTWNRLDLNGPIRIRISKRYNDDQYILAADSVKLEWQEDRTITLGETPNIDVVWEKWTFPFDDDDVEFWWEKVANAHRYEIEWRYLGFNTRELRETYGRLFEDISTSERRELQSRLQDLEQGYEELTAHGASRPNPRSGPDATCWVSTRRCEQWNKRVDGFDPNLPKHRVHSLQTHLLFQVRVRAINARGTAGPWSEWTAFPGMRESITCVAFDIYNVIKDVQFAIKAADFVLTVGAIASAIFSAGAGAVAGAVLKQVLKEFVAELVKKGVIRSVVRKVIRPLLIDYIKNTGKTAALRIFKVLAGCVTAGFDLDGDHSRSLWRDILEESALDLPRDQIENFLNDAW